MMPMAVAQSIYDPKALIAQLRAQATAVQAFAKAVGDFAYVLMAGMGKPNVEVAEALRDSLAGLLLCGTEEQIERIENPPVMPDPYKPRATIESLTYLIKERDPLQEQIEQAEGALAALRDNDATAPMAEMYEAAMVLPLRQRLDAINERISEIQAEMEKGADNEPER